MKKLLFFVVAYGWFAHAVSHTREDGEREYRDLQKKLKRDLFFPQSTQIFF